MAFFGGNFNVRAAWRDLPHGGRGPGRRRAKLPDALPVFQSCLSEMKIEIVPISSAEDLKPWAGTTAAKDLPVLVSAIQAKADVLVTGDKKDLLKIRNKVLPLTIASPGEFLNDILPRFLKS